MTSSSILLKTFTTSVYRRGKKQTRRLIFKKLQSEMASLMALFAQDRVRRWMKCCKGPLSEVDPWAAAVRTQSLYELSEMSFWGEF